MQIQIIDPSVDCSPILSRKSVLPNVTPVLSRNSMLQYQMLACSFPYLGATKCDAATYGQSRSVTVPKTTEQPSVGFAAEAF